jgi:hypothetical protein
MMCSTSFSEREAIEFPDHHGVQFAQVVEHAV